MASNVTFDPPNVSGLVATGTTLAAAAERLGVPIVLTCGGKGECTSCAVEVLENPFGLSEVTDAERAQLGEERIGQSIRLGCQASFHEGDCTLRVLESKQQHASAGSEKSTSDREHCSEAQFDEAKERIREAFASLPSSDEIAATIETQVKAAGDAISKLVEEPLKAGEQFLNTLFGNQDSSKPSDDDSSQNRDKHE